MNEKDFKSLIKLLGDPDFTIYEKIKNHLVKIENIDKILLNYYNQLLTPEQKKNYFYSLRNLLEDIVFDINLEKFKKWKSKDSENLFEPLIWIAQINNPFLDKQKLENKINESFHYYEVDFNLLPPIEKVLVIEKIIFDFLKVEIAYGLSSIDKFMIDKVLIYGHRAGLSLFLALYASYCWHFKLPILIVRGTHNFFPIYINFFHKKKDLIKFSKILFIINSYQRTILKKSELDRVLDADMIDKEKFYKLVSPKDIIRKILDDIITIQTKLDLSRNKTEKFEKIYKILS